MEVPDTTVRVLYDFEYTTKDGRKIKIKCGERLFLIKKTNNDWWQVIRSFERRPFYVPASYVEEIQRNKTDSNNDPDTFVQHQSLQHLESTGDLSIESDKTYRNRSFSLEDKRVSSYPNKDKINISKTHYSTLSSSGYESLSEIGLSGGDQNPNLPRTDTEYVNVRKEGDQFILEDVQAISAVSTGEAVSTDKAALLSNIDKSNNVQGTIFSQLNKIEIDNTKSGNYSNVSCVQESDSKSKSCSISKLPLSSSLEELAQEIELKTNKLRTCPDFTKLFHSSEGLVPKGMFDTSNIALNKSEESNISSVGISKKLQYVGSFKTKLERQKWAKQIFDHSNLKNVVEGEQMKSVSNVNTEDQSTKNLLSIDINYVNQDVAESIYKPLKVEEKMQKEAACSSQLFHDIFLKENMKRSGSRQSLDSIVEDNNSFNYITNSKVDQNSQQQVEALILLNVNTSEKVNLNKSSMDSLLELETGKISGGTTSDGDDLYLNNSDSETDSIILGISRLKNSADDVKENQKRRISLSRNRRVDSCKTRQYPIQAPPSPTSSQIPTRTLLDGWNEFITDDGRKFFFNNQTHEKSWKPPRRRYNSNEESQEKTDSTGNLYSGSSSPLAELDDLPLPTGWQTDVDKETGLPCYINISNGAKWFSSSDHEGRVYFFEENSNESSWTLPDATGSNINKNSEEKQKESLPQQPALPIAVRNLNRTVKSRSMVFTDRSEDPVLSHPGLRNWPQLWGGDMCVLKEGPLNRTKITENGKRLRKNWGTTHVVLTELFLLFFKDNKGFAAMKSGGARPELCVDLNGALIDRGDKVSSRKNVYMLSTVLGLQVLIQSDDHNIAENWLAAIYSAIKHLPMPLGLENNNRGLKGSRELPALEEPKKGSRIGRSKSVKLKHKDESMEDLSVSPADRQIKIRERLKKFFHRRPTMESLVKKGIWKDEPVFGCYLEQVCGAEFPRVPLFVQRCIQCIEQNEENMKTDGLYRASGNLSQVQKIRLQVDQNNYAILEQEEDVHVLTGALKLFFRELKQPLLPFHCFNKALKASTNHNRKEKLKDFREIVKALPIPNHDTLKFLLQHLLRVTKYQEFNRMHIPNLAIVFGPTLMWSEQESLNMAFDLMQQNLVIECFLAEFEQIFR